MKKCKFEKCNFFRYVEIDCCSFGLENNLKAQQILRNKFGNIKIKICLCESYPSKEIHWLIDGKFITSADVIYEYRTKPQLIKNINENL